MDLLDLPSILIDHSDLFLDSIHDSGSKTRVAILAGKASPPSSRLARVVGTGGVPQTFTDRVSPIQTRGQIRTTRLLLATLPDFHTFRRPCIWREWVADIALTVFSQPSVSCHILTYDWIANVELSF